MDLHLGSLSHELDFTIDVPVFRDGTVVYDLFLRLGPTVLQELVADQRLGPATMISVTDSAGLLVARIPDAERYVGSPIVPALYQAIRVRGQGITYAPALAGMKTIAAFAQI